ncbi:hypothetical protein K501DRAFT_330290 [Backusella circina FSU 941]|nr:hypothetical protein K501DRAFT_330290 [Backusella circina FSU 941]
MDVYQYSPATYLDASEKLTPKMKNDRELMSNVQTKEIFSLAEKNAIPRIKLSSKKSNDEITSMTEDEDDDTDGDDVDDIFPEPAHEKLKEDRPLSTHVTNDYQYAVYPNDSYTIVNANKIPKIHMNLSDKTQPIANSEKTLDELSSKKKYLSEPLQEEELAYSSTPHALRPPSHILKARRTSKHAIASSIFSEKEQINSPQPFVKRHHRANSCNSAVSPQFMAIRKLSEVTTLPSHTLSRPVQNTSDNAYRVLESDIQNKLMSKVSDIISTQLQVHLGQLIWQASESHSEAKKFWEDQKKEMLGFVATFIDRLDTESQRVNLDDDVETENLDEDEKQKWRSLKNELLKYKAKYADLQRQIFEMDMLRSRNNELEKECEVSAQKLADYDRQAAEKMKLESRLTELEQQMGDYAALSEIQNDQAKVDDLITLNKHLETQLCSMEQLNRQLHEQTLEYEEKLAQQKIGMELLKQKNQDLENDVRNYQRQNDAQVLQAPLSQEDAKSDRGLDCSEDFGMLKTKASPSNSKSNENWADIMTSEEEVKEWAEKYQALEASYSEMSQQLKLSADNEKEITEMSQSISTKDQEIRHLKQLENVNRIQLDYLQRELDKYQYSRSKPMTRSRPQKADYKTKDGYLTFTTEINGQLSQYSIKLPSSS